MLSAKKKYIWKNSKIKNNENKLSRVWWARNNKQQQEEE